MNVSPAWQKGYTGKGVVVSILDDGIQRNHPDLDKNYVSLIFLTIFLYIHPLFYELLPTSWADMKKYIFYDISMRNFFAVVLKVFFCATSSFSPSDDFVPGGVYGPQLGILR